MNEQRVVIVTGASGHLGSSIARLSADQGWAVVVHYRNGASTAEDLVGHIEGSGGRAIAVGADLGAGVDQAEFVVANAMDAFGRVDALVNNSADQTPAALADMSDDDWRMMLDINVLSATRMCSAVRPFLGVGGSIVNISSVEATSAFPNHAHYAASKAALESFTRSLALDLGPSGRRANAVAPGLIDREGLDATWPQGWAWWNSTAPTARPVTSDEVASAVTFLMADSASGINGVVLTVDGGWSASARASF